LDYILFDRSAVEFLASHREYQSLEYDEGSALVDLILKPNYITSSLGHRLQVKWTDNGAMLIGPEVTSFVLVIDFTTCDLLKFEGDNPDNLLLVFQRMFRAAIRIWNCQPFTGIERVNHSKLIVFPFPYNFNKKNNKRLVIEREPNSPDLLNRGISYPLLVYKYNDDDVAPGIEENPVPFILNLAGEEYARLLPFLTQKDSQRADNLSSQHQIKDVLAHAQTDGKGFRYQSFLEQYRHLTKKQREVVESPDHNRPIRIVGPAGTGKTTSMILRAYRLLSEAKEANEPKRMIFITHSESTCYEAEQTFLLLDHAEDFLYPFAEQFVEFTTLLSYCKQYRKIDDIQTIDEDAADAKEYQLMLIGDSYHEVKNSDYSAYRRALSDDMKAILDNTPENILLSLLQHEFSVQIKGRASGLFENYRELPPIENGLPVSSDEKYCDKRFIFSIFREYERQLKSMAAYDTDDIAIESLMSLNAPIWRRERADYGYDDVFVDEIHLFNQNEQHIFHFLTRDRELTPICFALDYSQAIGDQGNLNGSYLEQNLSKEAVAFNYDYVFRSTEYIVNFCKSLIASGVLLFQTNFFDPYKKRSGNSALIGDDSGQQPQLIMAQDEEPMLDALKPQIDRLRKTLQCKNHQIAIISFDDDYLKPEQIERIQTKIGQSLCYLEGRNVGKIKEAQNSQSIIITSPYNINGLEFSAVILLGVDGARVPQSVEINDISRNYLLHKAYNMLYLSASRASHGIVILGNCQNRISECLVHSLSVGTLEQIDI